MTADVNDLWPPMRAQVLALLADPEAKTAGVYVVSAFRSIDLQRQLFNDAVKRYGSEAVARKWVAPPGKSNHGPKVDLAGNEPGPYGRAVDFGIEGVPAVSGKWPKPKKQLMDRLAAKYHMHSPMQWEDWHYEPNPDMPADPAPPAPAEEDDMAMIALVPGLPADHAGRVQHWETDCDGNLKAWNGAPPLKPLSALAETHPPIKGIAALPDGSGVILFADDGHHEGPAGPDGEWAQSTYKITVGM